MDDKFTPKELETYRFLHDFRKNAGKGEITITFHNMDFDKLKNIQCEFVLTGNTASIEFYNNLMSVMMNLKEEGT